VQLELLLVLGNQVVRKRVAPQNARVGAVSQEAMDELELF
jgi:hypothetical protein